MGTTVKFPRFSHEQVLSCKQFLKEHGIKTREVQSCEIEVATEQELQAGESHEHYYCRTYLGSKKFNSEG